MFTKQYRFIDLTHTITTSIPAWQGTDSFSTNIIQDYHQGYRTQQFNIGSNTGTHIDAPAHFDLNAPMIDDITLDKLIVAVCVIDVSKKASNDYRVSVDDINSFEQQHGTIPSGSLVILNTGWHRHWIEPKKYRNLDSRNVMHFPGISLEAARVLLERNIVGIAIDTLSPDGSDTTFPVHKLLLGASKYIIENIAHADKLPPTGAYVIALPLKIHDAVEAPSRIIGIIPRENSAI